MAQITTRTPAVSRKGAIDRAEKNRYINTEALDNRIGQREMYNNARSDVTRSEIFGDIWKNQYIDDDLERQHMAIC